MRTIAQIPTSAHYAILRQTYTEVPTGGSSRFSERHEEIFDYEVFQEREPWERRAKDLHCRREKFLAIYVQPASVQSTVELVLPPA